MSFSNIEGSFPGTGNIDADPLFVDPDNGDFRLLPGSPCIDAGDNTAVPGEITTDLDGNPRFVDDPDTPDCQQAPGTCGDPPVVDMGAYEFQAAPPCPWDLNGDGVVNVLDLIELVMSFGPCEDCPADFDDDGFVNVLDLITLIMNFGPCPGTECVWDVNGDGVVDQADLDQVNDVDDSVAVEVPRAGLELVGTHVHDGWVAVAGVERVRVIDKARVAVEVGGGALRHGRVVAGVDAW